MTEFCAVFLILCVEFYSIYIINLLFYVPLTATWGKIKFV